MIYLLLGLVVLIVVLVVERARRGGPETNRSGGGDDGGGGDGGGGHGGDQSTGGGHHSPAAFAECGGKIFDDSGKFDAAEYAKQARLWDRAAIDCRLGPKFDFYHPGDKDDERPTAPLLPRTPNGAVYLCPEFNHDTPGPAGYGSTSGQVAYAPDSMTANRALVRKASMARALGIQVNLCGDPEQTLDRHQAAQYRT